MSDNASIRRRLEETEQLLALAPVVRTPCDLDLLVFLHRHPRTLLTNEQLATLVGYDVKQIASAIEAFIAAGILERTQNPKHAARMYLLVLTGPQGGGLKSLFERASTREGRREILLMLDASPAQNAVDMAQKKKRGHAIA